jgi:hypothetical protein
MYRDLGIGGDMSSKPPGKNRWAFFLKFIAALIRLAGWSHTGRPRRGLCAGARMKRQHAGQRRHGHQ